MIGTVTSASVLSHSDTKSTGRGPYYVLGCTTYTTKFINQRSRLSFLMVIYKKTMSNLEQNLQKYIETCPEEFSPLFLS